MSSKKNKIVITIVAVIAVATIAFFGVRNQMGKGADDKDVIRIGAILPLTGNASFLGEDEKKGIDAAVKMLAVQGIKVDVTYEDSANGARQGLNAFMKLLNGKKMNAVIIAHSGVVNAIVEYMNSNQTDMKTMPIVFGILMASDKIGQNLKVFARCIPTARVQTQNLFKYIAKKAPEIKRIGLLYQNDDYGADYFKYISESCNSPKNPKLIFAEAFEKNANDQKNLARKVLSRKEQVDAIFIIGNSSSYASVLKSIKDGGFKGQIFSEAAIETPALRKAAGEAATRGIIFSSAYNKGTTDIAMQYENELKKSGVGPSITNAYAAAATMIICDIINSEGKDKNAVQLLTAFLDRKFKTVLGDITFDQNRVAVVPVYIKIVKDLSPAHDQTLNLE